MDLDGSDTDTYAVIASNGRFLELAFEDAPLQTGYGVLPLVTDFTDSAKVRVGEPALRRVVTNFVYDTASSTITDLTPEIALSTTVRNDSDSDNLTQSLLYSYLVSVVGTWKTTIGGSLAFKASLKAKVPFLAEEKVETTLTINGSHEWGGSKIETKTVTSTSTVVVGPKKKGVATVLVKKATIDVPFTYTESTWYRSGKYEEVTKQGIYNNVESYQVDVQVSNMVSTD